MKLYLTLDNEILCGPCATNACYWPAELAPWEEEDVVQDMDPDRPIRNVCEHCGEQE